MRNISEKKLPFIYLLVSIPCNFASPGKIFNKKKLINRTLLHNTIHTIVPLIILSISIIHEQTNNHRIVRSFDSKFILIPVDTV